MRHAGAGCECAQLVHVEHEFRELRKVLVACVAARNRYVRVRYLVRRCGRRRDADRAPGVGRVRYRVHAGSVTHGELGMEAVGHRERAPLVPVAAGGFHTAAGQEGRGTVGDRDGHGRLEHPVRRTGPVLLPVDEEQGDQPRSLVPPSPAPDDDVREVLGVHRLCRQRAFHQLYGDPAGAGHSVVNPPRVALDLRLAPLVPRPGAVDGQLLDAVRHADRQPQRGGVQTGYVGRGRLGIAGLRFLLGRHAMVVERVGRDFLARRPQVAAVGVPHATGRQPPDDVVVHGVAGQFLRLVPLRPQQIAHDQLGEPVAQFLR